MHYLIPVHFIYRPEAGRRPTPAQENQYYAQYGKTPTRLARLAPLATLVFLVAIAFIAY